mmetsp:Transcript_18990/g.39892  ORF Transcript_18990/g.39892 Transcript_18990/m.39892 type:complete len:80 (-) Transcript_18990:436-675(-)
MTSDTTSSHTSFYHLLDEFISHGFHSIRKSVISEVSVPSSESYSSAGKEISHPTKSFGLFSTGYFRAAVVSVAPRVNSN